MKKNIKLLYATSIILLLILIYSCSKDNTTTNRSELMLDELGALDNKEIENYDYEVFGIMHNEILDQILGVPDFKQLSEQKQNSILADFLNDKYGYKYGLDLELIKRSERYKDLSSLETYKKMEEEKIITAKQSSMFRAIYNDLSAMDFLDQELILSYINDKVKEVKETNELTAKEKAPILVYCSIFKHSFKYWNEYYEGLGNQSSLRQSSCKSTKCLECFESNIESIIFEDSRFGGTVVALAIIDGRFRLFSSTSMAARASARALAILCPDCIGEIEGWYVSENANNAWVRINTSCYKASELGYGDFIGDSRTDVFLVSQGKWLISDGGTGSWQVVNASGYPFESLRFGDFIGDGKTDVFTSQAGQWYVSESATGAWKKLASSGYPIEELAFGDFVGDSKTDVFTSQGGKWYVSNKGTGSWQTMASSGVPINKLRFGDFVGDNKTDVFSSQSGKWFVSDKAVGSWQQINTSSYSVDDFRVHDFRGSNRADVFTVQAGQWYISESGTSSWIPVASSSASLHELRFGDFIGDNKTDVFTKLN